MKYKGIIALMLIIFMAHGADAQRDNRRVNRADRTNRVQQQRTERVPNRQINRQQNRRIERPSNRQVTRQPARRTVRQSQRRVVRRPSTVYRQSNRRIYRNSPRVIVRLPRLFLENRRAQISLFDRYDYNYDGVLSYYEFNNILYSGSRLQNSKRFFNSFDYNRDYCITRREFYNGMDNRRFY